MFILQLMFLLSVFGISFLFILRLVFGQEPFCQDGFALAIIFQMAIYLAYDWRHVCVCV